MKSYLLLRDNQESGPFTLEEIKEKCLRPYDLVWKQGDSTQWLYPTEFIELKAYVSKPEPKLVKIVTEKSDEEEIALHKDPFPKRMESLVYNYSSSNIVNNYGSDQFAEIYGYKYKANKFSFQKTLTRENPVWLFALLGALIFGAFVVKQMVEVMNSQFAYQSGIESTIAPVAAVPEDMVPKKPVNHDYRNALQTELVSVGITKKSRIPKLEDFKKMVQLSGSDYKVGVFGGIRGLQLNAANNSCYPLERIVIEVKYFKRNGKALSTEEYNLFDVPPGTEKLVDIPDNKRGYEVSYRIVGVESKTYKTALRQI